MPRPSQRHNREGLNLQGVIGVILAGGVSKRFGSNKAFFEYNGKRLIDIVYSKLSRASLVSEVYISAKSIITGYPPYKIILDSEEVSAPITGVISSLRHLRRDIFVVGCDMPCIDPHIVDFIISRALSSNVLFVSLSIKEGLMEPLFAYYSYNILDILLNKFKEGNYSLQDILREIGEKILIKLEDVPVNLKDAAKKSIININKPEDLLLLYNCLNDNNSKKW